VSSILAKSGDAVFYEISIVNKILLKKSLN